MRTSSPPCTGPLPTQLTMDPDVGVAVATHGDGRPNAGVCATPLTGHLSYVNLLPNSCVHWSMGPWGYSGYDSDHTSYVNQFISIMAGQDNANANYGRATATGATGGAHVSSGGGGGGGSGTVGQAPQVLSMDHYPFFEVSNSHPDLTCLALPA